MRTAHRPSSIVAMAADAFGNFRLASETDAEEAMDAGVYCVTAAPWYAYPEAST